MAGERTVVQAASEIRLLDTRIGSDFQRIQTRLLQLANNLERQMSVTIPVTVDTDTALGELAALEGIGVVIPATVAVDIERALGELRSLPDLAEEVRVPVTVDTTSVVGQVASAVGSVGTLTLPIRINTVQALLDLQSISAFGRQVLVSATLDTTGILDDLSVIQSLGADAAVRVPVDLNTDTALDDLQALAQLGQTVQVPIELNTEAVLGDLQRVTDIAARVRIPVVVDSAAALAELRTLVGFREPVVVPVVLASDAALNDLITLQSLGPDATITAPVDLDTDAALDELVALQNVGRGTEIPVGVNVATGARRAAEQIGPVMAPAARAAGERSGRQFGAGFSASVNLALTTGAVTAGALLADTLQSGYQRFTTIQDSTESLTVALDSATEAGALLGDVLTVVRGTPFRLDAFAAAATNLVAFGVEAEKVPYYLTAIGEASATRGSQATAFANQLASVFGRVSAVGRLMGDEVLSFGSVGVNALAILGNTFGKTTEEMQELISKGLVPADLALDALSKGILNGTDGINGATASFSGTMEKLGDTLSGSIENFGAARARLGVAIIEPIAPELTKGFQAMIEVVDLITPRVRAAFDNLVDSDFAANISEFFESLPDMIDPALDSLSRFGPILAPIGIALGARGLGQLRALSPVLGAFIPGVSSLAAAAAVAAAAFAVLNPQLREELGPLLQEVGEVARDFGERAIPAIADAADSAVPILARLINAAEGLLPAVETAADLGVTVLEGLAPAFDFLGDVLGKIPTPVLTALVGSLIALKAVTSITPLMVGFGTSLAAIPGRVTTAVSSLQTLSSSFVGPRTEAQQTQRTMATVGAAVAGTLAGMALSADDAAAQITGAIGGISAVLVGLQTGGLPGGAAAAGAVGIGWLIGELQEAKKEAEELQEEIGDLADRIRDEFDDRLIDLKGVLNSVVFGELLDKELTEEAKNQLDELHVSYADLAAELSKGPQSFQRWLEGLAAADIQAKLAAEGITVSLDDITSRLKVGDDSEFLNLGGIILGNHDQAKAGVAIIKEADRAWDSVLSSVANLNPAIADARRDQRLLSEDAADGARTVGHVTTDMLEAAKNAIIEVGEGFDTSAPEEWGDAVEDAADRAREAMEAFGDELDRIQDRLDFDIQLQDFAQGLRDLGESLNEVINQSDIDEADRIGDQIEDSYGRIADLRRRFADAVLKDNVDRAKIQDEIDSAQEEGRVNAAAALQQMLDGFVGDAGGVQADIDEEFAKIAELEARLSQLATQPITLLQEVTRQAAEAGIPLFEFLLAAPTPEAQKLFQDGIAGSVTEALAIAADVSETEGPLAGAKAAEEFLRGVRDTLIAAGLDEDTVNQLFSTRLDLGDLDTAAIESQLGEIQTLIANAEEEGASEFEVRTNIDAARTKFEELTGFIETHPEVTLPVGVSTGALDLLETQIGRLDEASTSIEEAIGRIPIIGSVLNAVTGEVEVDADTTAAEASIHELRNLVFAGVLLPTDIDDQIAQDKLAELRGEQETTDLTLPVTADTARAFEDIQELRDLVFAGAIMPVDVVRRTAQNASDIAALQGGRGQRGGADEAEFFRHGGFSGYEAGIATGLRIHGEWQTGGEAYMPLGLGDRPGSERIFMRVADIFGFDVTRRDAPRQVTEMPTALNVTVQAPAQGGGGPLSSRVAQTNQQLTGGPRSPLVGELHMHVPSLSDASKNMRALMNRLALIEMQHPDWDG